MPIFEVNGRQYDVDEQYISDFAKENPKAVTRVNQGESLLEISASDYPSYIYQTKPQIKEVPGTSFPSYQTKPEDLGFENVLDKKGFEQRYNVNPNVLSGRQTDPIQKGIETLREKVGKKSNIPQYPLGNRYTHGFGSDYANKTADRLSETQLSAATENELRGAEKAQSKGGFWDSFGRGLKDEGMWTQGLSEIDNNLTLLHIAKKAEKEGFDNLPEREQDLLTATTLRIASEAANSDEKTALQIAGMSTAESIPYMLQFMLTSSPASLATTPVRTAIKKAAEKAIRSGVSSKLIPVIKGAARTAAVTTKATAMTAMQPTMYADAVSRGTGKATLDENGKYAGMEDAESAPVAAYKAFANATVENLSEHSGAMLSGATGAAARALKKVPALGGFISNVQKNNVLSGATKMMKAVGFNGAPEEFFEEQVSTGLNSLIVGDSQFSDFTNWKQQLATLISVGATAGAMTSTGSLMSVPYKKQIKNNYSEATDLVKDYFSPDEFDQFRASLSNMNIDSRPDFISSVAEAKGFSVDEVKDLTVFATRQAQYDGYVGSVTDKIEEEKIQAQNEINQVSNKDMGEVLEVNGFGENPVNIVGGFVVFDDEGYVDKNKSSQTIYYLDEEGKRKMASPDKFGQLISRKPLADAYAEALNSVEENILIQEENELADEESPEQAQQDAVLLAENGNQVETPEGVGTISQVEQDENAAIVLFPNGISKKFALSILKPYKDPNDPNGPLTGGAMVEEQPSQTEDPSIQTEAQTAQTTQDIVQAAQSPSFPVDKEGNIDYTQIQEPEQYAQALQQEFEGDAVSVIDEQIQSAQARLEKAGKNSDAIKRRRAMKSEQAEVDRLNKVKAILSPREQIVNEMPAETVENEEVSPGGESNMIDLAQLTEPERRKYVAENSTDPIELADLYNQVKEEVDYSQMMPWEAAFVGRKVSKDSFIENSDKNNITGAMNKSWFSKDGKGLDVIATELSEYGIPVTEQDLVNFIISHPGNNVKKRSQLSIDTDRKFKEAVKNLTGQEVGGVDSPSGKLILAGLRAGARSEQDRQSMPFDAYTIPDSVLNFFEETGLNPEDFNSFEELGQAVNSEVENGTFVFPLSPTDLQTINNIINHGIEQQADYGKFSSRVEKAGIKRTAQQPVLETTETEAGTEGEKEGIEPTPEEIKEIEAQLEKPKRTGSVIDIINEIATEQNLRDAEKETSAAEDAPASEDLVEDELLYRESNNDSKSADEGDNLLSLDVINKGEIDYDKLKEISGRIESGGSTITRLNSAEEQGRIKGGRRAIEASILTGATRRTDRRGLSPSEPEDVILKKYAEKEGIFFSREDIENMSERKMPSGAESEVYESKDGKSVIKIVNYKMYSDSPLEFLDNRVSLNNYLFNETPYTLIGFTETKKGLSFVLTQPFIQGKNLSALAMTVQELVKQQSRVAMYMKDKFDMNPIDSSPTSFSNSNYVIEDLHLNNVKEGADGNLYFIDSIISLNEPSDNIGGHREYEEFGVNEDELMFRDVPSETDQIKAESEKNGTFLKAPNGKDSNLNEKQWLQVRAKAFKEWFGDWENDPENASKVVDENGEPRVVYHGSRNGKFDVFNPSKGNPTLGGGMYFSDSIELSKKFAGTKGFVYSVFLNIKNPMYGQFNGSGSDMSRSEYRDGGIFTKSNTDRYANEGEKEYIVFDPNQIKSATDNTGEFSQNNDDIRFRDSSSSIPGIAPNGKKSNLSNKQWNEVRSNEFKEWFGDWENDPENASKVVDENGEPLVMYHGTNTEFTKFSTDKTATPEFWFTDRKDLVESGEVGASGVGITMPVFLNIRKASSWKEEDDLSQDQIIQKGFDGKDLSEGNERTYVAFNSNQIKSATDNTGEFSQNNDDIRFRDAEIDRLDKEYMDAVESGDMEKAQRIVDQVAKKNGYVSSSDYRMTHQAPTSSKEGVPMDKVMDSDVVPKDYWTTPRYYLYERYDYDSYNNVKRAMKDGVITMYRSIPKDSKDSKFRNGDWVTPSKEYAKQEGANIPGGYRIIEESVPIENAYWDGNDINEWGFDDGKGYSYKNTKNNKKLNEAITRDDEGSIIPPSKRFNDRKSDPRYRGVFYSNAENAVKSIKQDKATPEQWLKMIEKTGGLKAGEDKWMGLSEWLKNSEAKTLTKQEVLDFINQNHIVVEEVQLGEGTDKKIMTGEAKHNIDIFDLTYKYINNNLVEGEENYDNRLRSIMTNANSIKGFEWVETVEDLKKAKEMVYDNPESYTTVKVSDINSIRLDYSTKGLENKREIVLTVPSIASWNSDDEIHFGDVSQGREVGWVRFGETTDSEGNRVMVIDEIQSKRHQQGREKGYVRSNENYETLEKEWVKSINDENAFRKELIDKYASESINPWEFDAFTTDEEDRKLNEFSVIQSELANEMAKVKILVPDAPFDKNWHELAMKRALRYAAENGFDKVAWTKGDQQAERYDLSNQINLIDVNTNAKPDRAVYVKMKGGNDITMFVDSNAMVQSTAGSIGIDVDGKRLDEVIGKEMAQKVMQVTNPTVFKDLELKVGGEGMKSFYDKMLPSFMNKYGKRWGVTVGEVTLPNVEESARTMHSVDVTQDMKASVMEGQPMFKDSTTETKEVSDVEKEATTLAGSLNTPIRVIRDVNEITNEDKRKEKRMRSAKGWYDPKTGEVVIVLPNADSVGDVQATILHEIVGHKGLRGLLGDKFEEMMDKVFEHLPKATRKKIMESAVNKYRFDHRTATEEYLAEFVEKDVMEPSIWQKIKSAIKSFFRDLGVNLEMNDADIAYLLWKSKNRLLRGDGAIEAINKVAKGEEAKERFREAAYTDADVLSDELDKSAREAWERLSKEKRTVHEIVNETAEVRKGILKYVPTNENVKKSIYELTQGLFDNAVSLRNLQHLVNTVSDQPIESFANPYQFLTTIPARNENKMNTFVKTKFSKIAQAIKELGVPLSTVQIYAYLKHGLERNEYMRAQDVREKGEKLKEAADLRIQAIADSIEAMSRQLETADKKGTNRILAKIEGYNLAIEGVKAELESKKQEYEKSVSHKDYSGVYAVADLFIKKSDDREFTVAQIETAIEEFEKEHDVTKFWEAINGATKWTVQNEFEMGRISKDLRDKLFSMYKYYIPLKGWEEKNANEEWDYISGGGVPVSPIKKAGGRKSLASNLFENIGLGAQTSVMGGHKNLLKLHALRMVRNYPNAMYRVSEVWAVKEGDDWVQKAPEYSEDPEVYADNVVKFEEEMKELKDLGLANKLGGKLNVGRPITKYEAKEHEILVYENGKPYVIYINGNPDIARAINLTGNKPYDVEMNDETGKDYMKKILNGTYSLMRFTGQNLTSRNPAFVAANLVMDSQWAIAAASAKEGSDYARRLVGNYMSPSIHRSIMRGVRGKLDESNPIDKLFGEFQRAGGETGYSDLFKVEDFEKMIKDELKDGVDWRKAYTWYTGSIDTLNRWAELSSRFSTFVTSRNSGRDVERSAYDAKEITLNFNRKGTGAFLGNWLKFAYLFAGAGLQGTYSMANLALSKRSQKKITLLFASTAMLGFLVPLINEMFLGGDDDDLYNNKADYERKSNFLIRVPGKDSFVKIPIAQALRPFYGIGESMYQMVKGNRNAGEGVMDIIGGFGMMLPFDPFGGSSLWPTFAQPGLQVKENKDFFGKEIYKNDSFSQYDPEFKRAYANTSPMIVELTRALNDITGGDEVTKGKVNINPGIVEHLVEGYFGGAFKFLNDVGKQVNGAYEVSKGNPYPYDSRSYPIIGRFYTNTSSGADINAEYYKNVNDAEEISHRVKKYQDLGKRGDQEAFDKSLELINSKEYQNAIFVNKMKSQIDNVKKSAKNVEGETLKMLKEQEKELKIMMLNEIDKLNEK